VSGQRKLAAILAADVVGYSKLAGSDEERTLARLRALRSDLIDPTIAVHHGRVVKRTGDGSLVDFRSVVDAVRCAIEVQNGMIERNAGLPPERRIEFRIGIHIGDVVEESDGDLMGDGVNIAARLEGIAKSGAICLSEDAYRQVKGRLDLTVSDLGATQLKNIAEPVRVYSLEVGKSLPTKPTRPTLSKHVLLGGGIVALIVMAAGAAWNFRGITPSPSAPPQTASAPAVAAPPLSIVVLPFANLGGDPSQQFLADVLTEELTTGLARLPGFPVIARSTAFTYKGKPVDVKQVGKELAVRYALEGSEQHSGDKVRVNAQLIDAESSTHLWADQFDEDRSDLLRMQDDIVTRVARSLHFELVTTDAARLTRSHPGTLGADDLSLRCQAASLNSEARPDGLQEAARLCEQALQANDRDAWALSQVSLKYSVGVLNAQSTDPQADLAKADDLVSRALALEPNYFFAHFVKSYVLLGRKRTEEALAESERALVLNPSFTDNCVPLCLANNYLVRPDRCLELVDKAIRISPRDPFVRLFYFHKGWALIEKQHYGQAIEALRLSIPNGAAAFPYLLLASALALTDHTSEAHETLQQYLAYPGGTPGATIAQLRAFQMSAADNPAWIAYNERLFEGLRKAGMPEE
jgi:adenylate cyclase